MSRFFPLLLLTLLLMSACAARDVGKVEKQVIGGNPELGYTAIQTYGCGSCHMIPGVPGANALVGPPLNEYQHRHYIAGNLPNTADNLIFWLQNPQLVEPGTAMPDMGVSESDARNIAAYLYSR